MVGWKHTVLVERAGTLHKLCKLIYGRDGTYMVTCPYHPEKRALLLKSTINYDVNRDFIPFDAALELAVLQDDERRLKLSHHPDGFLQFSGDGVVSGRDENGQPKGIGIQSWPLTMPVSGPSFAFVFRGVEAFEAALKEGPNSIVFRTGDQPPPDSSRDDGLALEGFYLHPFWKRFLMWNQGQPLVLLSHPSGGILPLRVVLPPPECQLSGFIGLNLAANPRVDGLRETPSPSFILSSSTGNLRRNEYGQLLGDQLACMYPAADYPVRRILNYSPVKLDPREIPVAPPAGSKIGVLSPDGVPGAKEAGPTGPPSA